MDANAHPRHPAAMSETLADFEAARLTVRLGAIAANYRTYRRLAGPTAVAAVVKADGYGLGTARVAPALAEAGCDSFFVARLEEGVALRATYIVDPEGVIRWVTANDLSVGRNVDETLRVLDALQTDELCPCNWKKGEKTLGKAA